MNRSKLVIVLLLSVVLLVIFGCGSKTPRPGSEMPVADTLINPFSPTSIIGLNVRDCTPVRVTVYDVYGKSLGVVLDSIICGHMEIDVVQPRIVTDSVTNLPDTLYRGARTNGVYLYQVEFPDTTVYRKMVVLK